ncbi:MAG TPA: PQQ-binding-like beta-propeller repeat protein [Methylomirabilota bacterium]|nr:PQQ-binding-like beta-propeller repeat protein [Methylomirabilota bacterium]
MRFLTARSRSVPAQGCLLALLVSQATAADQPQWGHAWTRNQVSTQTGLPESFNPATGHQVKWSARLGTEAHSTPVIANGRVYIGTNNNEPRDPRHQGDRGVLMCFDESDGTLLWQLVVPKRSEDPYFDWPNSGISSPVTVEGDRVYVVSNRGEVLCLDARGLADGNDGPYRDEGRHMTPAGQPPMEPGPLDADILWLFDLTDGAGIWSHDGAHSSILIHGGQLYLNTGTGVDNTHRTIRTPDAPSLVVLDKSDGRLLATDGQGIAPRIFHCTWSSPSMAEVNGRPLLFFAGGNGVVYAFEPLSHTPPPGEVAELTKVWEFDFDPDAPKEDIHRYVSNKRESPSNIFGMPVFHENRLYVAGGGDLWWGKNEAWLKCIDATGEGDITETGLEWSRPIGRHVMSTPAVHEGLVFIADCDYFVRCFDAKTGEPYWTHETEGDFWASPYVADGRVYLGTRRGDFWVFAADREKRLLHRTDFGAPISSTATAANGVLYVATMTHLYALANASAESSN